jgi:phytoene synthase
MPARELWRRLEARSRSNLYFALAFLPSLKREAFRDAYRFLRAADDLVDSELSAAEKRAGLETWRRELDAIYAGAATHPDAARLAATVRRVGLSRAHFETILDALEEDIPPRRFATTAELERWCERQSGTLALLSLEILGARGGAAEAYARAMGVALQLANILRDVDEDARRGHLYLPLDVLTAAGADPDDVLARRPSPALADACRRLATRTRALVAEARAHLAAAGAEARAALLVPEIWADVYLALLDQLAAVGHDPFAARPPLRKRTRLRLALRRLLVHEAQRAARHLPFPQSS